LALAGQMLYPLSHASTTKWVNDLNRYS
jgi:hypothetical protein